MKALKTLGIIILVLVVIIIIAMFIAPTGMSIERSTTIDAPKNVVWNNVKSLDAFQAWSPWRDKDTDMTVTFSGNTGEVGESYSWEGNDKVGKGKEEITKIDPMERVETELTFIDGSNEQKALNYLNLEGEDTGMVEVKWGIDAKVPRPWNVMLLFGGQKEMESVKKDFDEGLAKLKTLCEEQQKKIEEMAAKASQFDIMDTVFTAKTYIGKREKVKMGDMHNYFMTNFGKLAGLAQANGMQMTGAMSALYWTWDENNQESEMTAAMPVMEKKGDLKGYNAIAIPESKAYEIDYYGNYDDIGKAHMAMDDYLKENQMADKINVVVEEYITNPESEPDTSKWLTKIYYVLNNK